MNGPCIWTATGHLLHDFFSGPQLQAAIAFLRAHPGQVSPITLSLSSNDLPLLLGPCTINGQLDLPCVQANAPAFIAGLARRLSSILYQLRSAAICALTLLCTQNDSHPSDLGYKALALVVFGASDYGRLFLQR